MDLEARAHSEHPDELRLWLRLLTCTQLVEKEVRNGLREQFATTLPRFDLMAQLERSPEGLKMNELSRRMMVTGGNVTGITDQLVAEELVERVNVEQNKHLAKLVKSYLTAENKISVLGVAFKDKTPVIEASPAISMIQELVIDDVDVTIYDPLAMDSARTVFDDEISYAPSVEDCLKSSPVCVLTLMSKEYREALESFEPEGTLTLIDCWRQLDPAKLNAKINLIPLGRFTDSETI